MAWSRVASRVSALGHPLFVVRSAKPDEIVCEKSTAVTLCEIVLPLPVVGVALGVMGPMVSWTLYFIAFNFLL